MRQGLCSKGILHLEPGVNVHTSLCMGVHKHACTRVHTRACVHMQVRVYVHACTCVCGHACVLGVGQGAEHQSSRQSSSLPSLRQAYPGGGLGSGGCSLSPRPLPPQPRHGTSSRQGETHSQEPLVTQARSVLAYGEEGRTPIRPPSSTPRAGTLWGPLPSVSL